MRSGEPPLRQAHEQVRDDPPEQGHAGVKTDWQSRPQGEGLACGIEPDLDEESESGEEKGEKGTSVAASFFSAPGEERSGRERN